MPEAHFYPAVGGDDTNWVPGSPGEFFPAEEALGFGDIGTGIGIRFPNVTIPPGATITSAHVTLVACNPLIGEDAANCFFNDVDNAVAPTSYEEAAALAKTSSVSWNLPDTTGNTAFDSPDLAGILQNIIDRPGWASGNAVQVIFEVTAVVGTRDAYAIEFNSGQYKPELHVVYLNPPSPGTLNEILPALEATGTVNVRSASVDQFLPPLEISAIGLTGNLADLNQVLPALDLGAYGGGRIEAVLPALELSGHILTGVSGSLDQILPLFEISAHGFAAQAGAVVAVLPCLEISAHGFGTVVGRLSATLPALTLRASGVSGAVGSALLILPALELEATGFAEALGSLDQVLPALEINARGRTIPAIVTYKILVLNPKGLALSEYAGLAFNSFALFNGKYLGATSTGIHVLEGDRDNGKNIDANLCLGQIPVSGGKPRDIWVMGRSKGPMIVTMSEDEDPAEEDRVEYLISSLGEDRAKVPRGMDPTYFQVGLKNAQGCAFDLDAIQVFGEAIQRRKA